MRFRLFVGGLAIWLSSLSMAASTYIIPVHAVPDLQAAPAWISHIKISNVHDVATEVRVKNILPYGDNVKCGVTNPWTIPPHNTTVLYVFCNGAVAIEIETDLPVGVTADVSLFVSDTTHRNREASRESIGVARAWLERDVDYFIPEVEVNDFVRSNLYVINPSSEVLRLEFQRLSDFTMPVRTVLVPPRSSVALTMDYDPTTCLNGGDVLNYGCATPLRVRGNGSFFAAVSVVSNSSNMASFRVPIE